MAVTLDLKLLLLVAVANGAPLVAKMVLGHRLSYPLDCRLKLADGEPLFGLSKSFRGVALAVIATALVAPLLGIAWRIGALIAALAMAGDLCSSFLKRRLKLPASSMALGLDQLPESLFPLLGCVPFFPLSATDIAAIVICFFAGELLMSRALYELHLRDRPY